MAGSWARQSDLRRQLPIFSEFRIADFPDSIISASGVVSSHTLLLHDDFCTPLINHHEVRDLQSIRKLWILDLPDFFTGLLSQAKLLLHLRSFSPFFQLFDLCFLDSIINVSTLLGVLRFEPELYDVGHFVVVQFSPRSGIVLVDWILWCVFSP